MSRLHLLATPVEAAQAIAQAYLDNPRPTVFGRSTAEIISAIATASGYVVHYETPTGHVAGTAGVYHRAHGTHDVGGVLVLQNTFGLMRIALQTLAVQLHLTNDRYTAITATMFSSNLPSIISTERAHFERYRTAPAEVVRDCNLKAGGQPWRIYHMTSDGAAKAAKDLVELKKAPVLRNRAGDRLELVLDHPLFHRWFDALENLASLAPADGARAEGFSGGKAFLS